MDNNYKIIEEGSQILEPFLSQYGFKKSRPIADIGSGGNFIIQEFSKDTRIIKLFFRFSLAVTYIAEELELDHSTYMKFLGVKNNKYPGFSDEPIQSFSDLLHDLENFCSDFIKGSGQQFKKYARDFRNNPNKFKGLSSL